MALNIQSNPMKEEYYTKELKKSPESKFKTLRFQKYYTGGSIVLMFAVLACLYLIFN